MSNEIILKILLVGQSHSGKNELLKIYQGDIFNSHLSYIEFVTKKIKLNDININLQIWDTAGQERFKTLSNSFVRNSNGLMFIYDITNRNSFTLIKDFYRDTKELNIKSIIVGTNLDLEDKRQVSKELLKEFCEKNNIIGFEISLKLYNNDVSKCFESLVNLIIENKSKEELIKLYGDKNKKKKKEIKFKSEKVSLNNDEKISFKNLNKYLDF